MRPFAIVTCGPAHTPVDRVRRITNFSTGALGIALSNALAAAGWRVRCYKGEGATCADPCAADEVSLFTTNGSLWDALADPALPQPDAVFHAAALNDWEVERLADHAGVPLEGRGKIESRAGRLTVELRPARKLLPELRAIFPRAFLAGWKYEVDGGPEQAVARGRRQLEECGTDLCVVNGPAWGAGFCLLSPRGADFRCADTPGLCAELLRMASRTLPGPAAEE